MLFQIATGYEDIKKFPQEDIIYIVSSLDRSKEHNLPFFFTDGHARSAKAAKYTDEKDVLYAMNGYYLKGYEQKESKPFEPLELVPSRVKEVDEFLKREASISEMKRLEHVANFIQGFESPYGLELLTTIDFLAKKTNSLDTKVIQTELSKWSMRKGDLFPPNHINLAIGHLENHKKALY